MKNLTLLGLGLLGLLVLLVSSPILSDVINTEASVGWQKSCQTGDRHEVTHVPPGTFVCFDPLAKLGGLDADNTDNSPMISVTQCENIDILFFDDIVGSPADANTALAYTCGNPTDPDGNGPNTAAFTAAEVTGICNIIENVTLDGVEATDTEAIYGVAAEWIFVDPTGTWTGDMGRIIVRCNSR